MKKIAFTAAALFVLAGSTLSAVNVYTPTTVAQKTTTTKPGPKTDAIPPAVCPMNDPNGCGIFG